MTHSMLHLKTPIKALNVKNIHLVKYGQSEWIGHSSIYRVLVVLVLKCCINFCQSPEFDFLSGSWWYAYETGCQSPKCPINELPVSLYSCLFLLVRLWKVSMKKKIWTRTKNASVYNVFTFIRNKWTELQVTQSRLCLKWKTSNWAEALKFTVTEHLVPGSSVTLLGSGQWAAQLIKLKLM